MNFLLLHEASSFILVWSLLLDVNITILHFLIVIKLCLFTFVIIQVVPLTHSLFRKLLVFIMNISFNLLNISLCILLSLSFKLLKRFLKLGFHLTLHLSLLNFNIVLLLLNGFLKTCAILLPCHEFKLILKLLFAYRLHLFQILIHLMHLNIGITNLSFGILIHLTNLTIIILNSFILYFFISFF